VCFLAVMPALAQARAQSQGSIGTAALHGCVRDPSGKPLANATVFLVHGTLQQALSTPSETAHTDSEGHYRFSALQAGSYTLRAEMAGHTGAAAGPLNLANDGMPQVDLTLVPTKASEPQTALRGAPTTAKPGVQAPEFFDEPQFTVAGVTQATNSGGHSSDTVVRTTEALARATVSLGKDSGDRSNVPSPDGTESSLRDAEAHNPKDPALHHALADLEEKLGNPLEAVREYQRAAELDPSEAYLFDWGTELLTHRALEPAAEVLTKGNRLFPKSVRMMIALGVVWYARGSYDVATQFLGAASDLAPGNATPYLFIGRMLSVESDPPKGSVARLARFAELQPDSALANYYYALCLEKQSAIVGDSDAEHSAHVEALLRKAVRLDPRLGGAFLQLGILYSQRADFLLAISAYRKAIEVSPESDGTLAEAHYRLAQAYLRTGNKSGARQELELHAVLAKKTKEDTVRERREIQEFVISLHDKNSGSPQRP
jgi:tetratricopeptide (TPR) repeat protein